jgi:hypothetical protein
VNNKIPIEQLLRWRLLRAEAEAPPAPCAARLLELARPWWETWPERFQLALGRLTRIQIAYGHAMAEPHPSRSGHPVPPLIVQTVEELETSVRVLYLNVRNGQLRLRFQLNAAPARAEQNFEVTFVSNPASRPLFSARRQVGGQRVSAERGTFGRGREGLGTAEGDGPDAFSIDSSSGYNSRVI